MQGEVRSLSCFLLCKKLAAIYRFLGICAYSTALYICDYSSFCSSKCNACFFVAIVEYRITDVTYACVDSVNSCIKTAYFRLTCCLFCRYFTFNLRILCSQGTNLRSKACIKVIYLALNFRIFSSQYTNFSVYIVCQIAYCVLTCSLFCVNVTLQGEVRSLSCFLLCKKLAAIYRFLGICAYSTALYICDYSSFCSSKCNACFFVAIVEYRITDVTYACVDSVNSCIKTAYFRLTCCLFCRYFTFNLRILCSQGTNLRSKACIKVIYRALNFRIFSSQFAYLVCKACINVVNLALNFSIFSSQYTYFSVYIVCQIGYCVLTCSLFCINVTL